MSGISDRFKAIDKSRSAPARLVYHKVVPTSGSNFKGGETCRLKCPANKIASYVDVNASFFSTDVKSSAPSVKMSSIGCSGFFSSVSLRNQGAQLSNIMNYPVYRAIHQKNGQVDKQYMAGDGNIQHGMKDTVDGITMTSGQTYSFTEPLSNLVGSFFGNGTYIPLFSADSLEIDLVCGVNSYNFSYLQTDLTPSGLSNAAKAQSDHDADDNGLLFSNVVLYLAIVECAPQVDSQIIASHNGIFKYLAVNTTSFVSTITLGTQSHVFNLGASMSSVNSINIVLSKQVPKYDHQWQTFEKNKIVKVTLMIDGTPVMISGGILSKSSAINKSFARIASHHLSDLAIYGNESLAEYDARSFIVSIDCESMIGKSDALRSGMNISSCISTIEVEFSTPTTEVLTMTAFVNFDALISLDCTTTRSFELSI